MATKKGQSFRTKTKKSAVVVPKRTTNTDEPANVKAPNIPSMLDPLNVNIQRALEYVKELEAEGLIGAEKGKALEDLRTELLAVQREFHDRVTRTMEMVNPEASRKKGSLVEHLPQRPEDEFPIHFNAIPPFGEHRFSFAESEKSE